MDNVDRASTLEELENNTWSAPEFGSHLVEACHALRKVSLQQLTVENIRMLIGQQIGLKYITPIAIEHLEENPWCSGNFYDGDLLQNVLKINKAFWNDHNDLFDRLSEIINRVESNITLYHKDFLPAWDEITKTTDGIL